MKKFLLKTGLLLLIILVVMALFDFVYTGVYTHAAPRNKTQYLMQLNNTRIDYIFLGSSRTEEHIVTSLVESETGKKAINLGISSAKPDDLYLQLKLLIHNHVSFEKVFIQVDYSYNIEAPSTIVAAGTLPYIRNNEVIKEHLKQTNPKFLPYYYIPFYRYADNDFAIGFRAAFLTAFNKKKVDFNDGFDPKNGTFSNIKAPLPKDIIERSHVFDSIQRLCKVNHINVVYFTAPYCSDLANYDYTEKLKQKIPGLRDYSKAITGKEYFIDCLHLNEAGAKLFTKMLVANCIKDKP